MVEVLLHIYRSSQDFGEFDEWEGADQTRIAEDEQEIHLRGAGTLEGFFLRISANSSLSIVKLKLYKNGNVVRTIEIDSVGQSGITFLPANQLPLSFFADDVIVMEWAGISTGTFITAEIGFELKFISQSAPAP